MRYLLLCVMVITACAPAIRPGPPMLKHVALPADILESNPAIRQSSGATLPQKWWEAFHDNNLDEVIDIALSGNPSLGEAYARLGEAQAVVTQAKSTLLPNIHSAGDISRLHNSQNGNHDIYNGKTATIANIDPLVANYRPDFWGRDSEIIGAARAYKAMAAAELRQSALIVSSTVIKTYFALLTTMQLVAIQSEVVKQSEEQTHLLHVAYQAGIQPKIRTISEDIDLLEAKSALASLEERVDADRFALLALLGRPPSDTIPPISADLSIPGRFDIPQELGLDLISQRPDIQAALWNIKQQAHSENVARDAFYPNVDLHAVAGLNSIGLANLFRAGSIAYSFGPAIDLPLFEGGARRGRLQEAESDYGLAVYAYNRAVLESVQQIAMALAAMKDARIQLDDRTASVSLTISKLAMAEQGFRAGIYDRFPYLEAEIAVNRERMAHLKATLNFINSITDLATSLGGGFGSWRG